MGDTLIPMDDKRHPHRDGAMKKDLFAALLESAEDALAHAKGKRQLRTTTLPGAPKVRGAEEVRALRERLNASQAVFAHFLNVSTKLVQAWEANRRRPDGAALRLLELGEANPRVVFRGLPISTPKKEPRALTAKRTKATGTRAAVKRGER